MSDDNGSTSTITQTEIFHALVALGAVVTSQNALFLSITEALATSGAFKDTDARKEYFGAVRKMLGEASVFNEQLIKISEKLNDEVKKTGDGNPDE